MKIDKAHIDQIRKQFAELQNKKDLVKLLSDAKNMLYGEECKPFQLKSLTYYANPAHCKKRYQTFTIKKKSGAARTIHAPVKGLKSILRSLNFVLQCVYEPHKAATGFVLGKSIVDNAKKHVGRHYVYNIDLKDFFHSFDRNRVKLAFMHKPFNLNGKREELAFLLASLCTHPMEINGEVKMVLPQGSPTSPTLTNILCKKLDRRLNGLAKRYGATYSRYADDITFSSQHNLYNKEEFLNELKRIIEEDNLYKFKDKTIAIGPQLKVNDKKVRLQKASYRQEATGLIVNEKVNVRRRYVKQIRMWLYYWEKYGYEKAEQIFKRDYMADKGHVKNMNANLVNVLNGKLEFLKMVKGNDDETYRGLMKRFNKLSGLDKDESTTIESEIPQTYKTPDISQQIKYPILHFPQKIVEALSCFTANDMYLKYTTHSWEKGRYKSYDDFMIGLTEEWKKISKKLRELSPRLSAKISNFLFNDKLGQKDEIGYYISWGEKKLKFGWSSPALKEYMASPDKDPFACPIPLTIKELDSDHDFHFFEDYAKAFKNEIEFREDSRNLRKTVTDLRKKILVYDFNIDGIDQLDGCSFFTDVQWVKQAMEKIFRMYANEHYRHFNKIKIERYSSLDTAPKFHLFKITQLDSFVKRQVKDPKFTNPSGDLADIIKALQNLCDYSITNKFGDGKSYRINYLTSEPKELIENLSLESEGFTHELKFYL